LPSGKSLRKKVNEDFGAGANRVPFASAGNHLHALGIW
jgi:hypothetical protein